ncbi:MAG: class I SAM-dependent methyltransferase [Vicinamibacterales bacterium]
MDVLPHHFYSPIPDMAELRADSSWQVATSMAGVAGRDIESQEAFARECCTAESMAALATRELYATAVRENGEGGGYGPIEAEFLYCFLRAHRPSRIVQVGCGVSTAVILGAARDAGYAPDLVCIDPFPTSFLESACQNGCVRLVRAKAQHVGLGELTSLAPNDMLFVDSTHAVKPGSEVNRIVLEVLPRLPAGVWVHFHDIYFPYDYTRDVLDGDLFFASESTLLHAFLIHNPRYAIQVSLSMLHYAAPQTLATLLPRYQPQRNEHGLRAEGGKDFPSAIYLRTMT